MQDVKNDTVRNSLWLNGLSAIFLMIMLLFVPPVTAVHAAEESQWTYDEGSRLWFYTDQNGWKYAMSSKDADSYELWSIAKKLKNITIKAENLTSKKLSKNIWKDTAKKMVVKVPAKKVNTYKKLLKKYGNSTIVVKKI